MATLSSALRRAAICISRTRRNHHSFLFSVHDRLRSPALSDCYRFRFTTTASNRGSSEEPLLQVIETEIQCAEETDNYERVEETPKGFPFKMEDNPGAQTITLTREYYGERVKVEVHMSNLVTGINEDQDSEEEEETEEEDEDKPEKPKQSSVPLFVTLSKKTGPGLEFRCIALPDKITIKDMWVRYLDDPCMDRSSYEGPNFRELNEGLRKAFHRYIEIRGIKPSMLNFLHEHMINKDSREHLLWLKTLKNFIQP